MHKENTIKLFDLPKKLIQKSRSMKRKSAVYIMTNQNHTVFYTGVTSNLLVRVHQHKEKEYPKSFTARYNVNKLVYFEFFYSIEEAIVREKEVKKYRREKKIALIKGLNNEWKHLYIELQ